LNVFDPALIVTSADSLYLVCI